MGVKFSKVIEALEVEGFRRLRGTYKLNTTVYWRQWHSWAGHLSSLPDELVALLTVPRIRLALQGAGSPYDVYERIPLTPGARLAIEIYRRPGTSLASDEASLAVSALLFTVAFIGLGKAASRGFGHFQVESVDVESGEVEAPIKHVRFDSLEGIKNAFEILGEKLLETTAKLLGYNSAELLKKVSDLQADTSKVLDFVKISRVPLFLTVITHKQWIDRLKHPCPYALQEYSASSLQNCISNKVTITPTGSYHIDILYALSAVGKATLKNTWKKYHEVIGVRRRGNIPVRVRDPGVAYHTWPLGLPRSVRRKNTGYYIAEGVFHGETCSRKPRASEGRRLSTLFFTVGCTSTSCFVVVEPFLSYLDFENVRDKMIHMGVHGSLIHVVNVFDAAIRARLGHAGCPPDDAGVAMPKIPPGNPASDPVLDPVMASIEWVNELLS